MLVKCFIYFKLHAQEQKKASYIFLLLDFNPISAGIWNGYLMPGGGGLRAPLCFQWKDALRPIIFYTVGERFIDTKNPKMSLLASKLWILESKIVLIWELEIPIFAEHCVNIQRNFWAPILKWPPKIIGGR